MRGAHENEVPAIASSHTLLPEDSREIPRSATRSRRRVYLADNRELPRDKSAPRRCVTLLSLNASLHRSLSRSRAAFRRLHCVLKQEVVTRLRPAAVAGRANESLVRFIRDVHEKKFTGSQADEESTRDPARLEFSLASLYVAWPGSRLINVFLGISGRRER